MILVMDGMVEMWSACFDDKSELFKEIGFDYYYIEYQVSEESLDITYMEFGIEKHYIFNRLE